MSFYRVDAKLADWQSFYADFFGLRLDFSSIQIPKKREGFDRLLVVAQGMNLERIFKKCKEFFLFWRSWDNFEAISSDRMAERDYAIWIRDDAEADEENQIMSANDLREAGILGITLEERFIYELKYFRENRKSWRTAGRRLDAENMTLCCGSRFPDGFVPFAGWDSGLGVIILGRCAPACRRKYLRSRTAVTL